MTQQEARKQILRQVFDDRLKKVSAHLVIPFMDPNSFDEDQLEILKQKAVDPVLEKDASFEQMVEFVIFAGEGAAMKAFMDFTKQVVDQWNAQNEDGRHLTYEINVVIK